MAHLSRAPAAGYAIGIIAAVAVTVVRYALTNYLGDTAALAPYVLPVMFAGWYGGLRPALVTTGASVLLCVYFIVPPPLSLTVAGGPHAAGLAIYIVCAVVISALFESLHRAWDAAQLQQHRLQREAARHEEARVQVQAAHENMGDAFHLLDARGRFTYINPTARAMFASQGVDADALIGQQVWQAFPALRETPVEAEVRRVISERGRTAFEHFYLPWQRWFSVRLFPSPDGGVAVHLTDTTALHALTKELRASATQLALAVDAANLSAFEWDVATGVVTRLGEVPPDAPLGARYTIADMVDAVHPDDQASVLGRLEATLQGTSDDFISEHRSNDNPKREWCWTRTRGRLTRDASGTPLAMMGVAMDITEHKRLEEALRTADRRKDDFLATLAHELRNPLAPIGNALQLLKARGPVDEDVTHCRDVIDRQVAQLARLLDDLRDVSRISRGTLELRREATSLRAILDRAVETSQPWIARRGHKLCVDLPDGDDIAMRGDSFRLTQVFSNLLNNAAHYTDNDGAITVRARREGEDVVVSVCDNGIGLDADSLESVFEIFARAAPARMRSSDGLGIGLSLARSIVMLHGGSLTASSDGPGRGSEFRVRIPLFAEAASHGHAARLDAAPTPAEDGCMSPWRIVIADDMRDAADSLAELLRLRGHEVATAYDGAEAIALSEAFRPEAVLLDLGMPHVDGYEACRRIRGTAWGTELPIVALTGWGQPVDRELSRSAGFSAHLVKPVDFQTVIATLDDLRQARTQSSH